MNPLLIESLARQQRLSSPRGAARHALIVRVPRRRRPWSARFGEALITLGSRLAFARLDASLVSVRESW